MTLKDWMEKQGLRDAQVAKMVGVLSRSQVNRIKRGKSRPRVEAAKALSQLTKIPVANFLLGTAA